MMCICRSAKTGELIQVKQDAIKAGKADAKRLGEEMKRIEKEVQEITAKRDKELAAGGKVQKLQDRLKELQKELAKTKTQQELKRSTLAEEEKRVEDLQAQAVDLGKQKQDKTAALQAVSDKYAKLKTTYDASSNALKQAESLLQTLITGLSSSSTDAEATSSGYLGQIAQSKNKISSLGTEAENAKARIEHLTRELKEKEPRAKKAASEDSGLVKELEKAKQVVEQLEKEISSLDWDEQKEEALSATKENAGREVRELLEKKDQLKSRLASLDFNYQSPSRDFDRSKVKGLVATLVEMDQKNAQYATALEVCAGGRLYNVSLLTEIDLKSLRAWLTIG